MENEKHLVNIDSGEKNRGKWENQQKNYFCPEKQTSAISLTLTKMKHLRGIIMCTAEQKMRLRRGKNTGHRCVCMWERFIWAFLFCLSSATRSYIHLPSKPQSVFLWTLFWFFFVSFRLTQGSKKHHIVTKSRRERTCFFCTNYKIVWWSFNLNKKKLFRKNSIKLWN